MLLVLSLVNGSPGSASHALSVSYWHGVRQVATTSSAAVDVTSVSSVELPTPATKKLDVFATF